MVDVVDKTGSYLFLSLAHGVPCILHEVFNLARALALVPRTVGSTDLELEAEESSVGALGHAERTRLTLSALALAAFIIGRADQGVGRSDGGLDETADVNIVVFDFGTENSLGVDGVSLERLLDGIAKLVEVCDELDAWLVRNYDRRTAHRGCCVMVARRVVA